MIDLSPGQRLPLDGAATIELAVDIASNDVPLIRTALLICQGTPGAQPPVDAVLEGKPQALDHAVSLTFDGKQRYRIDVSKIADTDLRFVLVLWIADGAHRRGDVLASVERLRVEVGDLTATRARFERDPAAFKREAALLQVEVYHKTSWRVRADGSGFLGGLPAMAKRLKLQNEARVALERCPPTGGASRSASRADHVLPIVLLKEGPHGRSGSAPRDLLDAVGRIYGVTNDGRPFTGTAFAVTPGGALVTCAHVVADAASLAVALGSTPALRPVVTVAMNEELDLAIVAIADLSGTTSWLQLADDEEPAEIGTMVGLLGYPLGELGGEVNYSQGIVNSVRNRKNGTFYQVDAGAAPGSSGGPLFRRSDGRVLGVLGSGLSGNIGMHANLAVNVSYLLELGWFAYEAPQDDD